MIHLSNLKTHRLPGSPAWALVLTCLLLAASSCGLPTNTGPIDHLPTATSPTSTPVSPTLTATISPSLTITPSPSHTITPSPSLTVTLAPTLTSTPTGTATPIPTYAILRGKVLEQANCRYGPGAPYLYKYGVYHGSNIELIGRNDLGSWVVIQAIGGSNPCWVKASLLAIKGDVMSLAPTYLPLPASPYYNPPTGVSAVRQGNEVTVSWNGLTLRAGDDSLQTPYVVEAWVCQDGQLLFTPVGAYVDLVTIRDEPGCDQPSHARLAAAEKHGYTAWGEIPWP